MATEEKEKISEKIEFSDESEKAELRQRFKESNLPLYVHEHCRMYPISEGVGCIQFSYPDWMSDDVRKSIDDLLIGFNDEMQDEIADNVVDLVIANAIVFTSLRHVDESLYRIYCQLADEIGAEGLREKIDAAYREVATRYGWSSVSQIKKESVLNDNN